MNLSKISKEYLCGRIKILPWCVHLRTFNLPSGHFYLRVVSLIGLEKTRGMRNEVILNGRNFCLHRCFVINYSSFTEYNDLTKGKYISLVYVVTFPTLHALNYDLLLMILHAEPGKLVSTNPPPPKK